MNISFSFQNRFFIVGPLIFFLLLSLLSADFFDPTFFHRLYPVNGIQNWCGVLGALIGGTLIELFGPISLVVPWFAFKIFSANKPHKYKPSDWFYLSTLLFSLSIAYNLWIPEVSKIPSSLPFILHKGYLGKIGAIWLEDTITIEATHALITILTLGCSIKLFKDIPFRLIFQSTINIIIIVPILFIQQLWKLLTQSQSKIILITATILLSISSNIRHLYYWITDFFSHEPSPTFDISELDESLELSPTEKEIEENFLKQLQSDFKSSKLDN